MTVSRLPDLHTDRQTDMTVGLKWYYKITTVEFMEKTN